MDPDFRYPQFGVVLEHLAETLDLDPFAMSTTDDITGLPLERMMGRYFVVAAVNREEVRIDLPSVFLSTIYRDILNTGRRLEALLPLPDRVALRREATSDLLVCVEGTVEKVRGNTYSNSNNLALIDARLVASYDRLTFIEPFRQRHD